MAYEISINGNGPLIIDDKSVDFVRRLSDGRRLYAVFNEGEPVTAEAIVLLPTEARVYDKVRRIPDVVSLPGVVWAVSQKLRDIIESFNSIRVEFFPIKLRRQSGEVIGQYYMMNIIEKFDALIVGQSTVEWSESDIRGLITQTLMVRALRNGEKGQKFTMSAPRLAGKHLWISKHLLIGVIYCSDQFYEKLQQEKITGLCFIHVDEINEEWDEFQNYGDNKWFTRWARIVDGRRQ